MKYKILPIILMLYTGIGAADCTNSNITPSTDDGSTLESNNNGTVVDNSTGLMWITCAQGQSWSATTNTCTGSPTLYQWDKALLAFKGFSFAGYSDWRVPNINELRSIIEDCRSEPAINTSLFPNAPATKFWSSSSYAALPNNAWLVEFGQGRDNFELKSKTNAIRLVRVK